MLGYKTDVGNVRKINEDYLGFTENEKYRLYIVADGMGGHNAGEVASKYAVTEILNKAKNINFDNNISTELINCVKGANEKIYKESIINEEYKGMGTTVTLALIFKDKLYVAHVGDSSCYVLEGDNIKKITKDHSFVQELIDIGSISEEEAKNHPNKNIITRSLGFSKELEVDVYELLIKGIRKIILCTDGLTNYINNDELKEVIEQDENTVACERLVSVAKNRGGSDNISIIVSEGENC
ncbi:MAG: Stp1/IreP family PP2C-type Ser/Thr phosphatase [Clostridiaceae bacterium]